MMKHWIGRAVLVIVSVLITVLAVEFGLWQAGIEPVYNHKTALVQMADFWDCNPERGCRFRPDRERGNRFAIVNERGFHDADEFVASDALMQTYRILVLGDSFTWGASAGTGHSYVEVLEQQMPDVTIWNTGIPASGTNSQIRSMREIAPVMQPDLILLGFFYNDFNDNVYPVDHFTRLDTFRSFALYGLAPDLTPVRLPDDVAYYRAFGVYPATSPLILRVGQTRTGTFLLRAVSRSAYSFDDMHRLPPPFVTEPYPNGWYRQYDEHSYQRTQMYLAEVQSYAASIGADLLVMDIPRVAHLKPVEQQARFVRNQARWFEEIEDTLDLPVLETLPLMTTSDYDDKGRSSHWNNQGHEKAAMALVRCLRPVIEQGLPIDTCHTADTD